MDKFWNFIKNEETEETELYFEGPISTESWLGDEITPALFRDELAKVSGDLTVWINSQLSVEMGPSKYNSVSFVSSFLIKFQNLSIF